MTAIATTALVDRIAALDRPLLVALDVDGTLAPIVRDPDLAAIPTPTLAVLEGLSVTEGVVLALITGRDLESLERIERIEGIWRAVEHGGLILPPGEEPARRALTEEQQRALDRFRAWADRDAKDAFIEHKPQAIAVHVRGIAEHDPEGAERLLEEADELAAKLGLHVRRGKALREAEAIHHDKGKALAEILRRTNAATTFFAGDDLTDFPAIELAASRGIGAFVHSDERPVKPSDDAVILSGVDQMSRVLQELYSRLRA
jgi:trehalose-phosphatase